MITLGIDTTANTASCALVRDGRLIAASTVDGTLTHSETMLPMLEQLLSHLDMTIADVDVFAVCEGPGSFTGVRIGVAMVKGLAFDSGKPCVGVSALESLALNADGLHGLIVPVMDARRSQVYTAIFNEGKRLTDDSLIPLSELCELLEKYDGDICFVGDGYDGAMKFFADNPRIKPTPAAMIPHSGLSCALLGERIYRESDGAEFTDRTLSPRYLRAPQAERERNERLAAEGNRI